ncbi:flagellar hook-length control protein FliK [Paenibacillus sp. NFR01]|uniref:flagellar hook-length control protein FliK n=1 Tax=Paenibacillus sp. NFR01 TaxID=1566279 RepID=UPI0008CC4E2A|nr:flagellar hook-length control protein FliK [Paenibacillus sp. NFR01]SET43699.1 flagellar hook-length control protein FliK [Paenibacillus sp. NFR01]
MSLVIPSFSGGNMQPTASTASAGTASSPTFVFAQTLQQTLGTQTANGSSQPLTANLASLLQGLLGNAGASGDTGTPSGEAQTGKVLDQLVKDLGQLDDNIASDPALLAALQNWLLQVNALLSGPNDASVQTTAEDGSNGLSLLAQQPATLRFAVQDELTRLVNMLQQTSAEGQSDILAKGTALLGDFTAILAENADEASKLKVKGTAAPQTAATATQPAAGVVNTAAQTGATAKTSAAPLTFTFASQAANTADSGNADSGGGQQGQAIAQTGATVDTHAAQAADKAKELKTSGELSDEPSAATDQAKGSDVVTAGQLALKSGIEMPLKAEHKQVHVQQFAQEMNSFISGKLDIVQKGGVAEATMTLFPDNLGQVDVKITMQNGHLVAQFLTEHSGAKDLLEQQMNQLRSALVSQGLQVEKLEVAQSSGSQAMFSQFTGQQGKQSGSGQQQERRSKARDEGQGDAVLAAELTGEWNEWVRSAQQSDSSQGGNFSAKA